jgi:hypothetical protein
VFFLSPLLCYTYLCRLYPISRPSMAVLDAHAYIYDPSRDDMLCSQPTPMMLGDLTAASDLWPFI